VSIHIIIVAKFYINSIIIFEVIKVIKKQFDAAPSALAGYKRHII